MIPIVLFGTFIILILIGTPIAFSIGFASLVTVVVSDIPLLVVPQKLFLASNSFPLLAIPFFMLAGKLMQEGGISRKLINFANNLIGFVAGGLGIVTTLSCMFFGAISGSSTGTVAAIGSIMIPAMDDNGYDDRYASALVSTAGSLGILIPPSIPLIIYGNVMGVSIANLFTAGIGAGIVCGLFIIIYNVFISKRKGYKGIGYIPTFKDIWQSFKDAILALLMPVIVLGGIYGGIFTPTEAAAIASLYGFIVGFFIYKEFGIKDMKEIFLTAIKNTSVVMLIIAASSFFGWIVSMNMIPQKIANLLLGLDISQGMLLSIILLFLVFIGTFMEGNAYIIILAPLFAPLMTSLGIGLIHFGIIMVVSVCVGVITPPLGVNLFTACSIYPVTIEGISKKILPFFIILVLTLFLIAFVPQISLFLL
ncbi:MAG TPA: TRAP transporter large permease [Clostridia bacterium]|nr:TRAP transporter large permease [Clostridia bacterium]